MPPIKPPKSSTLRRTFIVEKKTTIIRVRIPDSWLTKMREKARRHTDGNVSQYVRYCVYREINKK